MTETTDMATSRDRFLAWLNKWKPLLDLTVPSIFSFLVLAAIIAQAWIYNTQRKTMDQQRDVMNSQRALMSQQTDIMEKGLGLSERAYVGIASLTANMEGHEIVVLLENIGRLPAKNIRLQAQEYRWTPEHSKSSTTDFDAGEVQLFPGSFKMRVVVPLLNLKEEEINAVNGKHEILAVGGTIHYEDGFGNNDTTYFAFEYQPPPKQGWTASSSIIQIIKRYERTQ